ncbi:MAG: inner membrane CreD family protein [Candidatus Omnitrophota bacterium]
MFKRILALAFIFIFTTIAWFILAGVTTLRTYTQDRSLKKGVEQLWGSVQRQTAPDVYYSADTKDRQDNRADKQPVGAQIEAGTRTVIIDNSDIAVNLKLQYRKKGLLWYSVYQVGFQGKYRIVNNAKEKRKIAFIYKFPARGCIYDNFIFSIDGNKVQEIQPVSGRISTALDFKPNEAKIIEVSYDSQGMDEWWYIFGNDVAHIKDFKLTMLADFDKIDFPQGGISPTVKEKIPKGWKLTWQYTDLMSDIQIGMLMPHKLNPGPFVSKITSFAPVALFLFLFLMFIITIVKKINIHPMNYFFICAAFFSFHLLMAYLADHVDINLAFLISSIVSIFLVVSYMRLVAGWRFSFIETGLSQFVYLVLFSYAFFFEGYTGLAITICCIITLFVVMQFTGRIKWEEQLRTPKNNK